MKKCSAIITLCLFIFSNVAGFGQDVSSSSDNEDQAAPSFGIGSTAAGFGLGQSSSNTTDCALDPSDPNCATQSGLTGGSQKSGATGIPSIVSNEAAPSGAARPAGSAPTAPAAEAAQAATPTEFQNFVANSVGLVLPIYGQKLFLKPPTTFAPVDQVPVPADYVIGPGDRLMIRAWGQINLQADTVVDRNGQIFIPKVGTITVAGVKFAALQDQLRHEIERVFRNFELSVTLSQLRTIEIYVLGNAGSPGRYTVSSLSTLVNALFASGGPSAGGSMRNIELKREGKTVTNFDLYDLLVFGDKSKDMPLQPDDVIYIPPVGPEIAIAGSVNVPAIYELKDEDLQGAIRLAGGLTSTADGQQLTLERIENHATRKVETLALDEHGLSTKLQNGDVIRIISILPKFDNVVTLRGNVANPGRFPWHQGMRISDLIPNKETLLTRAFWNAQNQLIGGCEPAKPAVKVPATASYAQTPREMALQHVSTGQVTSGAQLSQLQQQQSQQQPLQTRKAPALQELTQPCSRTISNELELGADIRNATPEINFDYALIQRLNMVDLTTRLIPFNLGKVVFQHDPAADLELEPGDIVMVFSQRDVQVPLQKQSKFVRIEGEVNAPGVYKIQPGDTLRTVIRRAGGVTPDAYLFATEFTRESVRLDQQRVLQQTSATAGAQDMGQRQALAQWQSALATGRIVLQMKPSATSINAYPEIVLEDGDKIVIPPQVKTVSVGGAVYNQSAYLYHPGMRVQDYVREAGNGTRVADLKHLLVVRADGSILGPTGSSLDFWRPNLKKEHVLPGDTIVIPNKVLSGALVRNLQNWSQISGGLAITAAALAAATGH